MAIESKQVLSVEDTLQSSPFFCVILYASRFRFILKKGVGMLKKYVLGLFLGITAAFASGQQKTIAFFTPWSNTNAVLYMGGDSVATMTSLENYCGWFKATVDAPESDFKVYFKQTVGFNYVGAEGLVSTEPTMATEIALDSVAALSDTIWVQGYKTDVPALFSKYPGVLGDCPLKKIPVTVYDWLHGTKGDGDGSGKNGDPANGVSADFGSGGCSGKSKAVTGMVEYNLGPNGVPVRANPFPENCKITDHLDSWFLPQVIGMDTAGNEYTNMTCRDLYVSLDDDGFWLAEVSKDRISEGNEKNSDGMFLLDDFEYLDDAKTVPNPYFDQLKGTKIGKHNFGYTAKIQATFEYVPGQYFDFYGDDDVWVFIDNRLAVDIGGQHAQVAGAVDLDTIGQNTGNKLVPGKTYDFHIFYVERHTGSSNFRMRTSIDLHVDASIFLTSDNRDEGKRFEIWQINKKNKLSCNYDANSTELDTIGGVSTFTLTGGNLAESEILDVGTHYEGIVITSDSTFYIDSAAIVSNVALAPGHYFLEITLKADPSQKTKVEITVPSYAVPSVAFMKTDWTILGKNVSGDTAQIGEWAYATYQVNIAFFEEWAKVNNYNRKINLSFSDVNIDILDTVDGNKINAVNLDANGKATFFVRANAPVSGVTLTAKGAAAGVSVWTDLVFAAPPVPRVSNAIAIDRNGDGRADSLYVHFDKSLKQKSKLDSIQFTFGESFNTTSKFTIVNENDIVITAENLTPQNCSGDVCGFGSKVFTGGTSDVYVGSLNNWFTYEDKGKTGRFYMENEPIADGVGPVILTAVKSKNNSGNVMLLLTFSETVSDESKKNFVQMFDFLCVRSGENRTPENPMLQEGAEKTMWLIYGATAKDAVLPTSGDRVRFTVDGIVTDLAQNKAHKENPWVVIAGDQELSLESPNVVLIGEDPYDIIKKDSVTQALLIPNTAQNAQEIGDSLGVQGSLVDFDVSKIMIEQTQTAVNHLDAFIESRIDNTVHYDTTVTSISEEEALVQLFNDIRTVVVDTSYGFSEETVNGILDGAINEGNYKLIVRPEDQALIATMVEANVDASRDTTIAIDEILSVTQADLFDAIRQGKMDRELLQAGVSQELIDAIKNGDVNEFNIGEYRSGEKTVISGDDVELYYHTRYFSHLGEFVGDYSSSIKCSDRDLYGEEGCLKNKGRIFLAWNMRSNNGRLVGTGVYIERLEIKVIVNGKKNIHQVRDKLMGVRRKGGALSHKNSL